MRMMSLLCAMLLPVVALADASRPRPDMPLPEGTRAVRDIEYASAGGKKLLLDLYLPDASNSPAPLIVWIHGGGWASGDKASSPARRLLQQGYAVASINYRLSGDAVFPAQIIDCKAAVRWLRANAKNYGLDPDHFAAWGSSAGGHLAALLGTTANVAEFDQGANLGVSSRVQAVCDYFGPTDLLQMDAHLQGQGRRGHNDFRSPESRLIGGAIQENKEKARRANPIAFVTSDDPPFLIVHGDQDRIVPLHQSEILFKALRDAGVPVRFHTIQGAGHGLGFGGRLVDEMVQEFFDRHLKGKETGVREPAAVVSQSQAVLPGPEALVRRRLSERHGGK